MSRIEVYPTYGRRLNFLVREHPDKAYLWNEVIRLAARLMREDNGHMIAYPMKPEGLRLDTETKAALIQIARASERARWAFLSIAAREILRRETGARP